MPIAMNLAVRKPRPGYAQVLAVGPHGDSSTDQSVEPRLTTGAHVGARRCGDRSAGGRTPNASAGRAPPAGYA